MTAHDQGGNIRAIETLIARQFHSLSWSVEKQSDWASFEQGFFPGASLYAAARPAQSQAVAAFIERIKTLSRTSLRSFEQSVLGTEVHVFGNVAVALGVCRNIENRTVDVRGVEAFLLIKEEGAWRIVSQAWDTEGEATNIPDYLIAGDGVRS